MILVYGEISQSLEYQGCEAKEYEEYNIRTSEDGTYKGSDALSSFTDMIYEGSVAII